MASSPIGANCFREDGCIGKIIDNGEMILFAVGIITMLGATVFLWVASFLSANAFSWMDLVGYSLCFVSVVAFSLIAAVDGCRECCLVRGGNHDNQNNIRIENDEPERLLYVPRNNYTNDNEYYKTEGGTLKIRVKKNSLKNEPIEHLNRVVPSMEDHAKLNRIPNLYVNFLNDIGEQVGIDQGGLTKDFVDDLIGALTSKADLFSKSSTNGLAYPIAQTEQALEIYQKLGKFLMFCYNRNGTSLQIGNSISKSLFAVALALSAAEINGNFDDLSNERLQELYRLFRNAQTIDEDNGFLHVAKGKLEPQAEPINFFEKRGWAEHELIYLLELVISKNKLPAQLLITPSSLLSIENIETNDVFEDKDEQEIDDNLYNTHPQIQGIRSQISHMRQVQMLLRNDRWTDVDFGVAAEIVFEKVPNPGEFVNNANLEETKRGFTEENQNDSVHMRGVREALNQYANTWKEIRIPIEFSQPKWNKEQFEKAVDFIFDNFGIRARGFTSGLDCQRTKNTYQNVLKTVHVRGVKEGFLDDYSGNIRPALECLRDKDSRKAEKINELFEIQDEWGDEEFLEALELIFAEDNIEFQEIKNNPHILRKILYQINDWSDRQRIELLAERNWNDNHLNRALDILYAANAVPPNVPMSGEAIDYAAVQRLGFLAKPQLKSRVRQALEQLQLNQNTKSILQGIHAVAKGMKALCRKGNAAYQLVHFDRVWNRDFHGSNVTNFATALQGALDRRAIANAITYTGNNQVIQQKVRWLKEWIQDEATLLENIRKFLKFVVGVTSLPSNVDEIKISTLSRQVERVFRYSPNLVRAEENLRLQNGNYVREGEDYYPIIETEERVNIPAYPAAHTCSNTLDLVDEFTERTNSKELFIENLLTGIDMAGGEYGMG